MKSQPQKRRPAMKSKMRNISELNRESKALRRMARDIGGLGGVKFVELANLYQRQADKLTAELPHYIKGNV